MQPFSTLETIGDTPRKSKTQPEAITEARRSPIWINSNQTSAAGSKPKLPHRHEDLKIGNWFHFKELVTNKLQGLTKVVMKDNMRIFAIRNNRLIAIHRDLVIIQCSEWKKSRPSVMLPSLLQDRDKNGEDKTNRSKTN